MNQSPVNHSSQQPAITDAVLVPTALAMPELEVPESLSVAAAEARTVAPAQVNSIDAVTRARLLTVSDGASVSEIAAQMSSAQLSLAVVCDASGMVIGVISETMLVKRLGLASTSLVTERVIDVMARQIAACSPTDSLAEVLALMHSRSLAHVLVVDGDNRPQGVVYTRDGLRALLATGNFEEAQLRDYVMGVGYR